MKNTKDDCTQDDSPCFAVNQSRRAFFKTTGATILAAPAILTSRKSAAQVVVPPLSPSPPTTPWQQELPVVGEPLRQTDLFAGPLPPPQRDANTGAGEVGRAEHQRWDEFFAAPVVQPDEADLYELKVEAITDHVFHPDYPPQLVWNYVGRTESGAPHLNPTIFARYGRPIIIRLHNKLPEDHGSDSTALTGFGSPEISMHLHNLHTPSESDGFPGDFFSRTKKVRHSARQAYLRIIFIPTSMPDSMNLAVSGIVARRSAHCGITITR